ncbi:uncharacterized protein LOC131330596 [Rhododendron vialii]|uniref:uncharacterized protein LOC131330596 n=1 Tax=Rhododendron vialii TaxID=182163 RepID=UPI00265F94DF|nr:uncharacterized protein LOC131330596 [Rhododendron vialii]XP_058220212.1 uncharacterized protein LOC131330596 [Rhododendron vialii]
MQLRSMLISGSCAVFSLRFESGKDVSDFVKDITSWFSAQKENLEIYLYHSSDPVISQQSMVIIWWMKIQCSKRYEMEQCFGGTKLPFVLCFGTTRWKNDVFSFWYMTVHIIYSPWIVVLALDT